LKHSKLGIAMVGVAVVLFVLLIFLLTGKPRFFAKEIPLHSYTSNAAGLGDGNAVRINGISAGRITDVALSGKLDPARAIRIDFVVDRKMQKQIPSDSRVSIESDSPLSGAAFLQINKGQSKKTVQPNDTLESAGTPQLNQLVSQGYTVLDSAQAILNHATDIVGNVEDGKGTAGKLLQDQAFHDSLQDTSDEMKKLGNKLDARMTAVQQLSKNVQGVAGRVDDLSKGIQTGQGSTAMLLKDSKLRGNVNESMSQWNTLYARASSHEGTLGRLMPDGKVGKQLSATLGNARTTIDKVNAGQGTVGQFLVNPSLRDSINGTTRDAHQIMKEFRANPKKFFRIHVQIF
jgi:phospholipid/cholesterol/gamma-HCH transport system substrate-binding protein